MKNNYRHIVSVLTKPEKRKFIFLCTGNLLVSIADISSLAFLLLIINFYTPQSDSLNLSYLKSFAQAYPVVPAIALLIVFISKSFFGYYVYKVQQKFVNRISARISRTNLTAYLNGSFKHYVSTDSAAFVQKIYHQPVEYANYILSSALQITAEVAMVILSIVGLLIFNTKLLLLVGLVLLPAIVALSYITKKRLSGIRKNIEHVHEKTLQYLNETLEGYVETNIYGRNEKFIERYYRVQTRLNNYIADMQITQGLPARFFEMFAVFGLFILIIAKLYTQQDTLNIFNLGAFVAAAYKIIPGISRLINLSGMIKTYSYILPLMNNNANPDKRNSNPSPIENIYSVEFKNVRFSYNDLSILENLNFKLCAGMMVGITGKSGKGKTTLINLLLGLLKPVSGSIFFNNEKIAYADKNNLWRRVSFVKQESFIFHESVLNNITLFDEDCNTERLTKAICLAGLNDLINQLENGIDTILNEGGKNISGGQRQRIAIARALYKDADVIVLDEPFNELDKHSEIALLQNLKCMVQNKIIILISHSSKSLSFCDAVLEL